MRTNVVLDDRLMKTAMKAGNFSTKKSAIEAGLKMLIYFNAQKKLAALKGKVRWEGDLEKMRLDKGSKKG